jgi:hypothetical protein
MTAICQFCRALIVGPDALGDSEAARQKEYRQLSFLVSVHMSGEHDTDAGQEMMAVMGLAGSAIAMRYVSSSDAALDSFRVDAADKLIGTLAPAPVAPLISLAVGDCA